jgi:hypothetical protein
MARVHRVSRSNKEHTCGKGHVIPKGEPYTWARPGFRRRTPLIRCAAHPFRPSELTTSAASAPMAALEALEDEVQGMDPTSADTLDELETALEAFASAVREYADEREQALEAWEHGNSQLEELNDTAQTAAEEAEAIEVDGWDESEPEESDYAEADEDEDDYETALDAYQERLTEHVQAQIDAVLDAAQSIEF